MDFTLTTILGFSVIFIATTLGSSLVFFFKNDISDKTNTLFLGFAAGIMIAASVWSLLLPAIEQSAYLNGLAFMPAAVGFLLGGGFLVLLDKVVPHFHRGNELEEGPKSSLNRSAKMFLAITIHNIPEGLAVGFAFGAASMLATTEAALAALGLAIGIAVQNFPEGAAVSLPLKKSTGSNRKAFLFGTASGAVEPIAAVVGFLLAATLTAIQPYLLSFAAGAMIFVVAEDLIPDAKLGENSHLGTWAIMIGFTVMMVLDVALG